MIYLFIERLVNLFTETLHGLFIYSLNNYSFIYLYIKYNYIAIMSSTSENVIVVHF